MLLMHAALVAGWPAGLAGGCLPSPLDLRGGSLGPFSLIICENITVCLSGISWRWREVSPTPGLPGRAGPLNARQAGRQAGRQAARQPGSQAARQAERQAGRQAGSLARNLMVIARVPEDRSKTFKNN